MSTAASPIITTHPIGQINRWALTVITVAGLAVDAYVHFDLAGNYDPVRTSALSQGQLFRVEAIAAILAAVALLVWRRRASALAALVVAASGLAALLVYRYVDVGRVGPIPAMYEPVWFAEKAITAIAEAVASVSAALLLVSRRRA